MALAYASRGKSLYSMALSALPLSRTSSAVLSIDSSVIGFYCLTNKLTKLMLIIKLKEFWIDSFFY